MEPKIVDRREIMIAGIVAAGRNAGDINIHELWRQFEEDAAGIEQQVAGKGYEVHFEWEYAGVKQHYCMVGVEVGQIANIPVSMFLKMIPAGQYAVFTHQFKNGGFGKAYETINDWLHASDFEEALPFEIQCYDGRFRGPADPESEMEFYIPVRKKKFDDSGR